MSKSNKTNDCAVSISLIAPVGGLPPNALDLARIAVGKVACHAVSPIWAAERVAEGCCGDIAVAIDWAYRDGGSVAMVLVAEPGQTARVVAGGYGISASAAAVAAMPDGEPLETVLSRLDHSVPYSAGDILLMIGQTCEPIKADRHPDDAVPAGAWTEHEANL